MPERQLKNKRPITAEALIELRNIYSLNCDRNGKLLAFAADECDFDKSRRQSNLYVGFLNREEPKQLTFTEAGERSPIWSPDSKSLGFISSRPASSDGDDDDTEQIWIMREIGEARKLTDESEGIKQFDWLDDKHVVYLCQEPKLTAKKGLDERNADIKADVVIEDGDKRRLLFWTINIDTEEKKLLYAGDFGISHFVVSDDGAYIAYATNYTGEGRHEHLYDIWLLDVKAKTAKLFIKRKNSAWQMQFSPDSSALAFLAASNPEYSFSQANIFIASLETAEPVPLMADFDFNIDLFEWNRLDNCFYFLYEDKMYTRFGKFDPSSQEFVNLIYEDWDILDFAVGKSKIALVALSAVNPPEIYLLNKKGKLNKWSNFNKPFSDRYHIAKQEIIRWKSDNYEIEGLLAYPLHYQPGERYPLIVGIHGGPAGRIVNTLRNYFMHQALCARGYAVLIPNYRGSSGYGEAFLMSNLSDLGGGDYRDIMLGVDKAIEMGIADPDRLGVFGGSYGGYMTNWIITHTDRFKAAVSQFGIFNLITDYGNSNYPLWEKEYLGCFYWENPELYLALSPAKYADNIKTPTLIMHGDSDDNTFISNSKELYQAIKDQGITPTEYIVYPREGHGNQEPNHRLDESRRRLHWFNKYLNPSTPHHIGDVFKHEGWELVVSSVDPFIFGKRHDEHKPLHKIELTLSNLSPNKDELRLKADEIRLIDHQGKVYKAFGIPYNLLGAEGIIESRKSLIRVSADKDTGVISASIAVLFNLPRRGGEYTLHVADYPTVSIEIDGIKPKRKKKQ